MDYFGKKISLFIIPHCGGIQEAWFDNSILKLYLGNRDHVKFMENIPELENATAVYFLQRDNDVYIGEAENVFLRIKQEVKEKDNWDSFIILTSINGSITKAHVKFLERAFWKLARENLTSMNSINKNTPAAAKLPKHEIFLADEFMEHAIFLMKNLRLLDFTLIEKNILPEQKEEEFFIKLDNTHSSTLIMVDEHHFLLKKGSAIKAEIQKSFENNCYNTTRNSILSFKKVIPSETENFLIVKENVIFSSTSQAASVVLGRGANGRTEWKTLTQKTYNEYIKSKEIKELKL